MNMVQNTFQEKLTKTNDFVITFELVPGHGLKSRSLSKVLDFAQQAASDHILDAVTVTDNPSGFPSLSPDVLSHEISTKGIASIVHITCRDSSRFGLLSRLQQLHRLGIKNLLVLTGDFPAKYDSSIAKPCFDLDAVTLLCTINKMNEGVEPFCINRNHAENIRTDFFIGAGVSCCKYSESEQMMQYFKLLKKINNGAQYIITQLCFNTRKFHELRQFLHSNKIEIPLIGSAFILTEPAARFLNKGKVPGIYIPDQLYATIQKESQGSDKGENSRIERAAKLLAVLKGLGYRGAHIGGAPVYRDVMKIIKRFHEIEKKWDTFYDEFNYHYAQGFYLYQCNPQTKLNAKKESKKSEKSIKKIIAYLLYEPLHFLLFNPKIIYFSQLQLIAQKILKNTFYYYLFYWLEHIIKFILFDCRKCGDCVVFKMAYLCPESQCPKNLRNGPCGGSEKKFCEVDKEKSCVWVIVYERMNAINQLEKFKHGCLPPRNWALNQTSSWINFYLGMDNQKINPFRCKIHHHGKCHYG